MKPDTLDNFREIYERELKHYENNLEKLILSSQDVRVFVYEVCKACIVSQPVELTKHSKQHWSGYLPD